MNTHAKGYQWSRACVLYLREELGHHVTQRGLGQAGDDARLPIGPGWSLEFKNVAKWAPGQWLEQVESQRPFHMLGAVWAHRRGKAHPSQGFVVMSGEQFIALLKWMESKG